MEYNFEFISISPVLSFFDYQQQVKRQPRPGAAYLGAYHCTLDAFLDLVEETPLQQSWSLDRVVDSVISFWLNNGEQVHHWKQRLADAGSANVLVARVTDLESLRLEFESLLGYEP